MEAIFAVMNTSHGVVKVRPGKNSGLYGFEPMTYTIPVKCSTN